MAIKRLNDISYDQLIARPSEFARFHGLFFRIFPIASTGIFSRPGLVPVESQQVADRISRVAGRTSRRDGSIL